MKTAGDILKRALDCMGADGWCGLRNGGWFPVSDMVPDYARPAWRDGGDWFVLPDWATWNSGRYEWVQEGEPLLEVYLEKGDHGKWELICAKNCLAEVEHNRYSGLDHETAPDAFRAAQKWLDEQAKG